MTSDEIRTILEKIELAFLRAAEDYPRSRGPESAERTLITNLALQINRLIKDLKD